MATFKTLVLYTGPDGRAKFREEEVPLDAGTPQAMLSATFPSAGYQLRHSPVGFRSDFHCTANSAGYQLRHSPVGFRSDFHCTAKPQWVFVLAGEMEIGLQEGTSRVLRPGGHCYAADVLPPGATFDPKLHGHWSAQRGVDALITLFVRN